MIFTVLGLANILRSEHLPFNFFYPLEKLRKVLGEQAMAKSENFFNTLLQKAFLPADRHGKGELIN